jgi:hypothetical protein
MPAIDLARLKIQAARLAEKFSDPQAFPLALNDLLGYYTNRTIRAAQIAQRLSVPTFRTPRPVLRQIESELAVLAEKKPEEAIALCEVLWEADSLESRLLAAYLLGNIPSGQAIFALTILPTWLNQSTDKEIRTALLTDALARLRRERPEAFFSILEGWLGSAQSALQIWGLQALIPLLQDPQFENLPAIFRILRPAFLAAGPVTQLDFQVCLVALERVSLTETTAFLREIIRDNPEPMMLRIFRRILTGLSPELQEALRETLREQNIQALPS